jgi:ribosomal protein S18 acetylase RimI-like enzyme
MNVAIDVFRPEHARRFGQLNREWLEQYNLMEPSEEGQLADPQTHFVDCGGQIFVALHDDEVIGTCAIIPHGDDEFELAKLTVASEFRNQGIARRLVERCIGYLRERGVRRVMLLSNSQLRGAIRLYESFGFTHCAVPANAKYESADVCMALDLSTANQSDA